MEGVIWEELSQRRRKLIERKTKRLAKKYLVFKPAKKSMKVKGLFAICKLLHKKMIKNEKVPSADNQHWIDNGWLKNNFS
jgi:hypothetical protein